MDAISYQPYPINYGSPAPLLQINLPNSGYQAPGSGPDLLSLMGSRSASGVAVASTLWNANGGANVGYRGMRSYGNYGNYGNGMLSGGFIGAVKSSVVVGAVMSLVVNAVMLNRGQENFAMATTNVTGDVIASGIGGMAGAGATMLGASILGGFMAPGLLLTVGAGLCGIGGILLADTMLRQSQIFQTLQAKVYGLFA
jgi:hypothetical protein